VIQKRSRPASSFNLDLGLYSAYWTGAHAYHHTASASLHFALHEGLQIIAEDGLDNTFSRQRETANLLWHGLEQREIQPFIPLPYRLPPLTTARVPPGIDAHKVRGRLLNDYNIEIAAGFGSLKDQVWRIGLMGYSSRKENVTLFLAALDELMTGLS
jgi:alanine-glyoxylate transaminase/serine-glyoxylate transaminase/serine-pyruvate transaminase